MNRFPVTLTDELRALIASAAAERGLTADELAGKLTEDEMMRDPRFWEALRATLEKNEELYRRLARH